MQILAPQQNIDRFFAGLAAAARRALLLDYDGTLAPFRVERDQAAPYRGVREVLAEMLRAGHTRLVVVSGRRASELPALLGLDPRPEIWGTHGWERQAPDGTYTSPNLDARAVAGLAAAHEWAEQRGLLGQIERKPASLALHWRGLAPAAIAALRDAAQQRWPAIAEASGLALHRFDGGIELRAPGRDKGFAVRTLLGELGAGAAIAYLGDDLTDEDAFAALKGRGLSVLVREELRPTAADLWIRPPGELVDFLQRWHQACLER